MARTFKPMNSTAYDSLMRLAENFEFRLTQEIPALHKLIYLAMVECQTVDIGIAATMAKFRHEYTNYEQFTAVFTECRKLLSVTHPGHADEIETVLLVARRRAEQLLRSHIPALERVFAIEKKTAVRRVINDKVIPLTPKKKEAIA